MFVIHSFLDVIGDCRAVSHVGTNGACLLQMFLVALHCDLMVVQFNVLSLPCLFSRLKFLGVYHYSGNTSK